jgi:hypothetical protein
VFPLSATDTETDQMQGCNEDQIIPLTCFGRDDGVGDIKYQWALEPPLAINDLMASGSKVALAVKRSDTRVDMIF